MDFLTNDKLTIIGAAGMIGSNMAQTVMMMKLTPNLCLYDPFGKGLEGVAEEMYHCAFDGAEITYTTDMKEALSGAKYVVSSGGAPRKQGMTREDLLKGNCEIAEQLGKDIKAYAPDVKHVVIIFNPADLTGLVTLLHSGLKPSQLTTLAALDSTRLQSALAQEFGVQQCKVTGCHTYGGHGEQMGKMGRNQAECHSGRKENHRTQGPFFIPEPFIRGHRDDRGRHGRQAVHLAGRMLCRHP